MSDSTSSPSSSQESAAWGAAAGWSSLALGVLLLVIYGVSAETGWTPWTDPLGPWGASAQRAADPAVFERVLEDALDQAWHLLGGHTGGVVLEELTRDLQRLERAGRLIAGVLASAPENPRAHLLQGLRHLASGRKGDAIRSVERSLEVGGGHQSLLVLGTIYAHSGRPEQAEAVFQRAVEEYPHSISAWNNLGQTLWQLGRKVEAEAAYRRKLELQEQQVAESPTSAERPETADGDR